MVSIKITEGELDYDIPGITKKCKTWYRIYGELSSNTIPLICLHGGPGARSDYLHMPMENLSKKYGITVIVYDQIGCGRSTWLTEKKGDTDFFVPDLFVKELYNLIAKLDIRRWNLYGQSWGGMLGSHVASLRPEGLNKLVISNSPANMHDWVKSCNMWRAELPEEVEQTLLKHERDGTYNDPEYKKACDVFYERHLCRTLPWPEAVRMTNVWIDENPTVYHTMNGPTEFHVIGPLKDWDTTEAVKKIEVETLVISAFYDEGKEFVSAPFFKNIQKCKWVTLMESSHMSMWEEGEKYNKLLSDFIQY